MKARIFTWKMQLHVLQLEEYKLKRYFKWLVKNLTVSRLEKKKPLVWTKKARNLYFLSICYGLCITAFLPILYGFLGLAISVALLYFYFPLLGLAVLSLWPYEFVNRVYTKAKIKQKILKLKSNGLKVIGITGSYGKTTTKEFLYKLLATKYKVLKTPESYNTLFGIASVVELELDDYYDYFICEMGAYTRGDIKELCSVILPDHAILTGINEQHLERFGSIENTIKAKFELIESIPKEGFKVLNSDNETITKNYPKFSSNPILYGKETSTNLYDSVQINNGKTSFRLVVGDLELNIVDSNLTGEGNILNMLGACVLATKVGVSLEDLISVIPLVNQPNHRLEVLEQINGVTVIDDSYSSNLAGFSAALDFLNTFTDRPKVLVTPGIVELGQITEQKHVELGAKANGICTKVILVGESERTVALATAVDPGKLHKIDSIYSVKEKLSELNLVNPVVLLENDLPDHYLA